MYATIAKVANQTQIVYRTIFLFDADVLQSCQLGNIEG